MTTGGATGNLTGEGTLSALWSPSSCSPVHLTSKLPHNETLKLPYNSRTSNFLSGDIKTRFREQSLMDSFESKDLEGLVKARINLSTSSDNWQRRCLCAACTKRADRRVPSLEPLIKVNPKINRLCTTGKKCLPALGTITAKTPR
ncbi:hypothetical protein CC1G_15201 [Coprinopsis cinerea okayama7|uniref:Uncharacterized protein n=1 Tax=Coprinopsis cinerea (strain Okayama-7 / 130 / ATCC MYA-4618 / FGSC 9003) TaxID=240176 RepID=D6RPT4_COPC7|nr:hypothetical protein CC1G_15201 [Coprinopsis cinerea okayama7\|eukprot:XP_002910566.1 hypothetical protein CC1G_15201 [Coprinopsis cinerea okayama7\